MTGASKDNRTDDVLRRTMAAMDALRERLERKIAAEREPIAVVGLGCRFPGIEGAEEFAHFLQKGDSLVGRLDESRAAASAGPRAPRYRAGGFFADVAAFDADAFGITEDEAQAMDPHLRFLLEIARDAIEDAALAGGQLRRSRTAVILALGAQNNDYAAAVAASSAGLGKHAIPGSFHSLMPGRLSYHFDLRGPSFVVDAACASSLVAVDLACQSLRRGDCDYALVAAVNLVLSDVVSAAVDASGLWSASGRCRSFDDAADGFVRGEGAAVLVLRRASDAARDGDPVRSLILGAASGQDGRGNGIAAPNGPAQAAIMRRALDQAGIAPAEVGYVEAHATGTRLGDAIEAEAIDEVYRSAADRSGPLLVGALKPSLGHLEAASGMAALVRAIVARARGEIPASVAPVTLNREIAALDGRIAPAIRVQAWPDGAPCAAISAFGMSGTNAHVIIGPPPPGAVRSQGVPLAQSSQLVLAAADEELLRALAARLAASLDPQTDLQAFCHTLRAGRAGGGLTISADVRTIEDAGRLLTGIANGGALPRELEPDSTTDATPFAGKRLNLPTTPFRRRRYWPDFGATSVLGEPDPLTEDLFVALDWKPAASSAARPERRYFIEGDERLLSRVRAELSGAGIVLLPSGANDIAPDAPLDLLFCAGRSFSDLAALHGRLKALVERPGRTRLVIVTESAAGGNALAAAVTGLGRAICVEHPELRVQMIDLDPGLGGFAPAFAQALASESEPVMRLSAEGAMIPRLRRNILAHAPISPDPTASHLVTGGFGGIGRAVARLLVRRGAKHLILVGRHVRPVPEQDEFEKLGVSVTAIEADVADREGLELVFEQAAVAGRPVASVFHAAGTVSNDLLVNQESKDFAAPFRAKLLGASVLDALTRNRKLDAFVLFSSITAFVPLAGAAAYGAANASLGAIARARRKAGLPALCIYSGTWEGSGMLDGAGEGLAGRWAEHGIATMPQGDALAGIECLLTSDVAECTLARVDWTRIAAHATREASGAALFSELVATAESPKEPLRAEIALVSEADLPGIVRGAVARACRLDPQDPSLAAPFSELGLDSLAAISLRNDLSASLGLRLPASLAFNYPSVQAMTEVLARRLREREEKPGE